MLPSDALAPTARTAAGLLVLVASLAGLHGAKSPEEAPPAPAPTTTTTTEAVEVPWAPPAVPVPVEVEAPAPSTTTTAPPAPTTTTTAPTPPPTTVAPTPPSSPPPPPAPSREERCRAAIAAVAAEGLRPAPGFTIVCAPHDGTARQGWADIWCPDGSNGATCGGTLYIQPADDRPDSLWRRVVRHEIGHSWCAHHWVDFSEACARRYE